MQMLMFELPTSVSPCASVANRVLVQILSYENEFDLHDNEPHFHVNGFARRPVLTHKAKSNSEMAYINLSLPVISCL